MTQNEGGSREDVYRRDVGKAAEEVIVFHHCKTSQAPETHARMLRLRFVQDTVPTSERRDYAAG